MKQEECNNEKDDLKEKSDIDQIKDTIKSIVIEMDILHTKIKQLDNEFQESKEKIREKINEMIEIINKLK
jgi:coenzyme F420-reducing hydrogenase delta subunit